MKPAGFKFLGTKRYAVQRQLGSGTFGVVYQVYDRERQERVALKVLKRLNAARVYAFKREFRALTGLVHDNLVKLYELVQQDREWFFTMELVAGRTFMKYVRPQTRPGEADSKEALGSSEEPAISYDERRLRAAFAQLTAGLTALHSSGHLHRDVKPSNALVSDDGRVVLLDFGLVKEWGDDGSVDERVIGSVGYMSPEQGTAGELTPASDMYAVGAMMYQALTGRLPHLGDIFEVLVAKRSQDPVPPSTYGYVSKQLEDLCMALMDRDPKRRPTGNQLIKALGVQRRIGISTANLAGDSVNRRAMFVGREPELGVLDDAFSDVIDGHGVVVCLHGTSGMGKSALLNEYLARICSHATVLRGRCYERELVPHKALDSLMDALTRYLKGRSRLAAEQLMPRETRALARLFPVLDRVDAVAEFPARSHDVPNLQELRRRATVALRELFSRMGDHRPLVLSIDDVQWGDLDSVAVLTDLMALPGAPPLLLVLSYRTEERARAPFLRALLPALKNSLDARCIELEVGPLDRATGTALALSMFGKPEMTREPAVQLLAQQVAVEAHGSPFFIRELSSYLLAQDIRSLATSGLGVTLEQVVAERLSGLSTAAKRLLEVVAVASRPIAEGVALKAAQIRGDAQSSSVELRGGRFVSVSTSGGATFVESYHDRIREAVIASLAKDDLVRVHLRLATALEAGPAPDAESLAFHWHAAGRFPEAAHYATVAAEQAFAALAFDRAAESYRLALKLGAGETEGELALHERLARSLAYAGRGSEAARAYLDAEAHTDGEEAIELRCKAAQQYFFAGNMFDGTALFNDVLKQVELPSIPQSDRTSLFVLMRRRLQLRLRGLNMRDNGKNTPRQRLRIDVCYAVSATFAGVRPITATSLQTQHLLLALEAGEPYRVARGLGLEAIFSAMAGSGNRQRTQELLSRASAMAATLEGAQRSAAHAFVTGTKGICAYFEGEWKRSVQHLLEAETAMVGCAGLSYELGQVRGFLSLALFYAGAIAEAGQRVLPIVQDARTRGNRHTEALLVNVSYRHYLFTNDIAAARDELARGLGGFYDGFTVQDFEDRAGRARIALYRGDGDEAWSVLEKDWKRMVRAGMMRVQIIRVELHQLRAQAALTRAVTVAPQLRGKLLDLALADAKRIEKENVPWCSAVALPLRAAAAELRANHDEALQLLEAAQQQCTDCDMWAYAEALRWLRGALHGGTKSDELTGKSEQWMAHQNIRHPRRFSRLLVPGFPLCFSSDAG